MTFVQRFGDDGGVFARVLAGDGTEIAPEFQVNTYTAGRQGGEINRGLGVAVNRDGIITFAYPSEGLDGDRAAIAVSQFCLPPTGGVSCGDVTCSKHRSSALADTGAVTATDALLVLLGAVGADFCNPCECDVNGPGKVTATDALLVLQFAVGGSPVLSCPACANF